MTGTRTMTSPAASNVGLLDETARAAVVARFRARTPASQTAHERALKSLPAGVNRNIVHQWPYPVFIASGSGAYLTDLDGQHYLDLISNYTAMILERLGSEGRLRFTASGTEATLMAIRAARAYTHRPLIAKFEGGYHGLNDYAMVSLAPALDVAGP